MDPRATVAVGLSAIIALFGAGLWLGAERRPVAQPLPSYADLYAQVAPSVVSVRVGAGGERIGTGFAIDAHQVVTARHVVVGSLDVQVAELDGERLSARVVGMDARADLALLEVSGGALQPVLPGRTDTLRVGDTVVAIGAPYGLGHSLAVGVVGSLGRRVDDGVLEFLQLSMPLNPGNSGGPVFDGNGRVVGVLTGTHATAQSIAFAVPVEVLVEALPALRQGEHRSRGFLGLRAEDFGGGVVISAVTPGSPADLAGLGVGDVLLAVGDQPVRSSASLDRILDGLSGSTAQLRIRRSDGEVLIPVEIRDWAEEPVVVAGLTLRARPGSGGEVVAVREGSRGAKAGLAVGDRVRAVDGRPMRAPADVQQALGKAESAQIEVLRDGVPITLEVRR